MQVSHPNILISNFGLQELSRDMLSLKWLVCVFCCMVVQVTDNTCKVLRKKGCFEELETDINWNKVGFIKELLYLQNTVTGPPF